MNRYRTRQAKAVARPLSTQMVDRLAAMEGVGMLVLYWMFAAALFGGFALVMLGLVHWNSWMVLAGLLCFRSYPFLCRVADDLLQRDT